MANRFTIPVANVGDGITPSSGAKLTFSLSGTSTLSNTYSDEALTTANANPVIADANGIFGDIWLSPGIAYKVTLDDKNDVQQYEWDAVNGEASQAELTRSFDTKSAMVSATGITLGEVVRMLGYDAIGDGGENDFEAVAAATSTEDGGFYIDSTGSTAIQFRAVDYDRGVVNVRKFGAVKELVSDNSTLIQAGINALNDYEEIYWPPGKYLLEGPLDFTGKANIVLRGVPRASWLMFNHTTSPAIDFDNPVIPAASFRGIGVYGLTFYPSSTSSSLPALCFSMTNCPESSVEECVFIDCSTSAQLTMSECWSSYVSNRNFFSARENLTSTHGAPNNTGSGGACLDVETNSHNFVVEKNRIRTGSPGIKFSAGDASEVRNNSIEGNLTAGIVLDNATSAVKISGNYFEGGTQPDDIIYTSSGTNFSHTISGNYFHAVNGVLIEANCSTQGMVIKENNFYSGANGVELEAISTFSGVHIENNTFRDMATPYVIPSASMLTSGLVFPNNQLSIKNNITTGTTPDTGFQDGSPLSFPFGWDTFSGTGSASNSAVYHSGILLYDLAGSSSWVTLVAPSFDVSLKGEWITVNLALTSPAATNVSVTIDDAVATKTYTCNSTVDGTAPADNILYYKMSDTATYLRLRINVGTLTIRSLFPTIRKGCHADVVYKDHR